MAAIAGVITQLAKPCRICAINTGSCVGSIASNVAAIITLISAPDAAIRLLRTVSTSIPAGNWPMSEVMVPNVRAKPISTWVHLLDVR